MWTTIRGILADEKNIPEIPLYWQIIYARLGLRYEELSDDIE